MYTLFPFILLLIRIIRNLRRCPSNDSFRPQIWRVRHSQKKIRSANLLIIFDELFTIRGEVDRESLMSWSLLQRSNESRGHWSAALSPRGMVERQQWLLWLVYLWCKIPISRGYATWKLTNSYSGVTLQTSATTASQFLLGRVINFAMTGFCVVVTPIYQAECAPAELRGLITANLQFQIAFGQLVASLVNFGTQNIKGDSSWRIPIG